MDIQEHWNSPWKCSLMWHKAYVLSITSSCPFLSCFRVTKNWKTKSSIVLNVLLFLYALCVRLTVNNLGTYLTQLLCHLFSSSFISLMNVVMNYDLIPNFLYSSASICCLHSLILHDFHKFRFSQHVYQHKYATASFLNPYLLSFFSLKID